MKRPQAMRYAPFYCEENVFQLCAARRDRADAGSVALVTNPGRTVALFSQRAAPPGEPVVWDYHVLLVERGARGLDAWDLDSRLGAPVPFADYCDATFAPPGVLPPDLEPRFLVMPAERYLGRFSSDRSHMRDAGGRFQQPPPPWPAIERPDAPSFLGWLDEAAGAARSLGRWMALAEFLGLG